MKYAILALCALCMASIAHAESNKHPRSTCQFDLEAVLADTKGSESIECHSPLFYRTMFSESEFQFGMFMTCNGVGMPTCTSAAERLATLTNSGPCRDNFYRGLIEADPSDTSSSTLVFESELWLPFVFKTYSGNVLAMSVTFSEDEQQFDCKGPLSQMQDARERLK